MKRSIVLLFIASLLICTLLVSCSDDSDSQNADKLIGSWSCTYNNETVTLTFKESGSGTVVLTPRSGTPVINIKYAAEAGSLTIETADDYKMDFIYRIDDGYLFIKEQGSEKLAYKFTKNN